MTAKVLVVDDDEKCLRFACDMLEFHGFETVRAGSGEQALEIARLTPIRLALLDIQLPGIWGVETLQTLRAADPAWLRIPVIVMTASVMPAERSTLMSHGFAGFLAKPLSIKELVSTVRSVLASNGA